VWAPVEARQVDITSGSVPSMRLWLRWTATLLDDPYAHVATLAWMTDLPMLRASRLGSASGDSRTMPGGSFDQPSGRGLVYAAVGLILLGYASALRRSELVALTLVDVVPGPGGLLLTVRRSKT
jgi:hypothetical protein